MGLTGPVDTGSMIVKSGVAGLKLALSINRFKSGSACAINFVLYGHLGSVSLTMEQWEGTYGI
jgi:hypothetical protein